MTWFIFSLLSILALATAELTQQHLLNLKNGFNARTSAVLTFLFQSLIAIPFLFIFGLSDQIFSIFNQDIFPRVLLVTFISSIAMILYLKSFKVKNISISVIFISSSIIVSTFLGIIFFSESLDSLKFLGIALVLMAIVVVNYKNVTLEKNHLFGLLAGIIFGVSYVLDKSIVTSVHPFVYIFWSFLMISVWGFIFNSKTVLESIKNKKPTFYGPIMISGIAYFLFNFFTFTAYRFGGEVSRVDAINNSQVFLIILFEFFILKNTEGIMRKIISAILAVMGILLLATVK